jgi:hypothetical protein
MTDWHPSKSPIIPLLPQLIGALENVAPQKGRELRQLLSSVTIFVTDEPGFTFSVSGDADPRRLSVSIIGLEFLWLISFAHVAMYQNAKEPPETGDPAFQQSLADAEEMLQFAFADRGTASPRRSMPKTFPLPGFHAGQFPPDATIAELATELFACAVGWILHHELGHIALKHLDGVGRAPSIERDADAAATGWLLDQVKDSVIATKLGLGIALAVTALAGRLLVFGSDVSDLTRYPTVGERVRASLTHPALEPGSQVQDFMCYALKVHLEHSKIGIAVGPFDTAFECLQHYCGALTIYEQSL